MDSVKAAIHDEIWLLPPASRIRAMRVLLQYVTDEYTRVVVAAERELELEALVEKNSKKYYYYSSTGKPLMLKKATADWNILFGRFSVFLRHNFMQFIVGTSGYSYPGWKGSFYPVALPQKDMLRYYSQQFPTVELNNTFYRMPGEAMIASWLGQVPDAFRFAVKVPQTITHRKRLKEVGPSVEHLFSALSVLKHRLGPLLFQLPPNFKKDLPRLSECLNLIGDAIAAFEFRHLSWFDDEVFERLRAHDCALCAADVDEADPAKLVGTAKWGYVRLRRETYTDRELRGWIDRLRSQAWERAYVYFKHDDVGNGARLAARFLEFVMKDDQNLPPTRSNCR